VNQFLQNLPHMVIAGLVIAAVTILSLHGTISGGEALGLIGASAGFTMGVSGGSQSPSGAVGSLPAPSPSPGQTVTETIAHSIAAEPTPPPPATTTPAG
jgi:hypothetical protein